MTKKQKSKFKQLIRKERKKFLERDNWYCAESPGPNTANIITAALIDFIQQLQELANERSNKDSAETKV